MEQAEEKMEKMSGIYIYDKIYIYISIYIHIYIYFFITTVF